MVVLKHFRIFLCPRDVHDGPHDLLAFSFVSSTTAKGAVVYVRDVSQLVLNTRYSVGMSCLLAGTRVAAGSAASSSFTMKSGKSVAFSRFPGGIRCGSIRGGVRGGVRSRAADPKISGVVFEPFSAVESELATTQKAPSSSSYGRTDFHPECEAAINEQINIEYNVSYVYHAMYTYFARDNVGMLMID